MGESEVIDLTRSHSFWLELNAEVLILDDSINGTPRPAQAELIVIDEPETEPTGVTVARQRQPKRMSARIKKQLQNRASESAPAPAPRTPQEPTLYYGECPICRDRLGRRPMASTKCGHVFCISCIRQAVNIEKKCPTCRKVLKGATAYHALFL